ncbi:hypothetical protein SSP35_19_00870 [Streptomyces sp. NBRC 110611]|nr:hypothetical protein SSP35_19_00870 [Streptomyces sp. NBRC 110611]
MSAAGVLPPVTVDEVVVVMQRGTNRRAPGAAEKEGVVRCVAEKEAVRCVRRAFSRVRPAP